MHSLTMTEHSCANNQKGNHSLITHGEDDDLNEEIQNKQSSIEVIDSALNEVTNISSIRVKILKI